MNIPYIYKENGSIVLFVNGEQHIVDPTHMNYKVILEALKVQDEQTILDHLTIAKSISTFSKGKVEIKGDELFYGGKAFHNALSVRIIHMYTNGFNITPMVLFMENLMRNPVQASIDELYQFLESCDLPITDDGCFLAYKMVNSEYMDLYTGKVDNHIGCKPFMDRIDVDPDRNNVCSRGYHFASKEYIEKGSYGCQSRGDHMMVVKINPKDVVSIPIDYNFSKGRCWTYEVVNEIEWNQNIQPFYSGNAVDNEDDWDSQEDDEDVTSEDVELHPTESSRKFSKSEIFQILDLLDNDVALTTIAKEYNTSRRTIGRIRDCEAYEDYYDEWEAERL